MAKLSKKELERVQGMLNAFNQSKMQLADAELAKRSIINEIDKIKEEYTKIEAEMADKYGGGDSIRINVQTGHIEKKKDK
jgi:hypothetical protein